MDVNEIMRKNEVRDELVNNSRDVELEKELHNESILNPDINIISRILENVRNFVSKITKKENLKSPELRLVNTDLNTLNANKYAWQIPYFDPLSKNMYFQLSGGRYSFSQLKDTELVVVLGHEYFHFLELLIFPGQKSDSEIEKGIVSESRADYFSGYFIKYCLEMGFLSEKDIWELENFVWQLADPISSLGIEVKEKVFYSIDEDIHGTSEHRLDMFHRGLNDGNIDYLKDATNFIPEIIEELDSTKFTLY